MPVTCDIDFTHVCQDEFHRLDRSVMRLAFDIHNSMGRFFDERIYQDELSNRCRLSGFHPYREAVIRLIHDTFLKTYYVDLVIANAVVYELKTSESITSAHQNQLINYLLLTGTRHGKIVNFRPSSVQSRFVSTTLTRENRMKYRLNAENRDEVDALGRGLLEILIAIIEDWGTCLDIGAYREALLHFTTGPASGLLPVPVSCGGRIVSSQKMCLLDSDKAWHISAAKSNLASHERHIRRLLMHTGLRSLYWINLNKEEILFRTIKNDSVTK